VPGDTSATGPASAGQEPAAAAALTDAAAAVILRSIGEVAYAWDLASDRLAWGANAAEMLGLGEVAPPSSGRAYAALLDPGNATTRFDAVVKSGEPDTGQGVPFQIQYCLRLPGDPPVALWVEDTGRWFAGADGCPARAHGMLRVINERHAREERLAYLSRFDGLTGEMNRIHLTETLGAAFDDACRYRASCGFLIIAIDNLAQLNDSYGLNVADEVIGTVAKRIRAKMRTGDALGRFSGNKFGLVLRRCTPDDMAAAADRLLAAVRNDVVQTSAGGVAVTVTIGGVAAPRHARSVEEILSRAQEALDLAKSRRRGSFLAYRPSVEREAIRRDNIRATDQILAALNDRRILLAFEPVVDIHTRQPVFHECLMRIRLPDGALVPAGEVVPVAERLGLVRLIDYRVLELAIAELVAAPGLRASLNVSPASTSDPDWWSSLGAQLRAHPGVGARLTLEITETAAIHNLDDMRGFVTRAKDLGCQIAIDDFGAGHTSFRNLRLLGVDLIKVDGAFVQNLTRSQDDRVFVRTLIELGRELGLKTVAEWVQDETAAAMLADWGCDYLQGALVGLAALTHPWSRPQAGVAAS
jgi:diguanylate cyclase (GGDEF)-like protein